MHGHICNPLKGLTVKEGGYTINLIHKGGDQSMAKSKYSKYVNPLRLWTESVRPSYRGKMADFSLLFDEQVYPNAPLWVETFYAYAPGAGVGVPGALPSLWKGEERKRKGPWGQHSHNNFDELFLFWG